MAASLALLGLPSPAVADDVPALSAAASALSTTAAEQWLPHQRGTGMFVDPVKGPDVRYGNTMLGLSLMQRGRALGRPDMIRSGLRAVSLQMRATRHGSFDVLAQARAYRWATRNLAQDPGFLKVRAQWEAGLLALPRTLAGGENGIFCATDPSCFSNLKLVAALGDLELVRTGLRGGRGRLADPVRLRAAAVRTVLRIAPSIGGRHARRTGDFPIRDAGISSDPTANPLAYHVLTTMMLGQAAELLGQGAPRALRNAFGRSARALAGFMGPDGDVSYIGRGQGQVWAVAAAFDVGAMAARQTTDPASRRMYLAVAEAALTRLRDVHGVTGWGFALVPRLRGTWAADQPAPGGYAGLDQYADTAIYNGLAVWSLDHATRALEGVSGQVGQLPGRRDGTFLDPDRTHFATSTRRSTWWAIHTTSSHRLDARYGFGLSAAKIRTPTGWVDAVSPNPRTADRYRGPGPTLLLPRGRSLLPMSTRTVRRGARIVATGGWGRTATTIGPRRTTFRWTPSTDRLVLSFRPLAGAEYEYRVWFPADQAARVSSRGACAGDVCWRFSQRVRVTRLPEAASAYQRRLSGLAFRVRVARGDRTPLTSTTILRAAG